MSLSLFAALLLQTVPAPAPVCVKIAPPPAGLEAWNYGSVLSMEPVHVGRPLGLVLGDISTVTFPFPPERTPKQGTFGGVYKLYVPTVGTYRVALSDGAWIDLVREGKSLQSVAHTEGPACSGIRKIVDFDLTPGIYTLQLSGAAKWRMRILVAAK